MRISRPITVDDICCPNSEDLKEMARFLIEYSDTPEGREFVRGYPEIVQSLVETFSEKLKETTP